ncbi:methyltransferase domain-containing protein [Candidatus Phycosocius spiralis]|uniref:SAM-dependent methyltransferase n=1 Tax=Candidatus Phycosocius spiralis TaxID=2815099 RepID=A0ABQ4PX37_9PROT|nr:methyltransferase domain-containing protein [Candidatus Phycosocius spiralis]GIU67516.1 SAM-dependent methyltransferase [Candidatus Phycosocius spiralis]
MKTMIPTPLFDRKRLQRQRDRAAKTFASVSFLKERAVYDVCERLDLINRRFEAALDIGSHGGYFGRALKALPDIKDKVGFLAECDLNHAFLSTRTAPAFVADEDHMPLAPLSLDLVISTLVLHWVNDVPGFLAQVRHALRPDGLFLASFLGGRTLQELRLCLAQAEEEVLGTASPRVSPFADAQDGARLLQRAGFALPVADSDLVRVRYKNLFSIFRDLKAMGETAAFTKHESRPLTRTLIARAADIYQADYGDSDGRVGVTFEIITLTGWAPHESQQKPLAPGSAKMRLADALGTREVSAGEKPL